MRFEIVNDRGISVMSTVYISCIPEYDQLLSMTQAGYKFRLDGKIISKRRLKELMEEFKIECEDQ